jgi:M3 family oligoendopeptidase
MVYRRVTPEETAPQMESFTRRIRGAAAPDQALAAFYEYEALTARVETMMSLAQVRFTLNTEDPFYAAENDYYDETAPRFAALTQALYRALFDSPHRAALEAALGALLFMNIGIELKTFAPAVVPDLQEENRLVTAYVKLLSSAQIEFDGRVWTLSQLAPYEQSPDRNVRRGACEAKAAFFEAHAQAFDAIFDTLVRVRTKIARTLGFANFTELGYCRMGRNCYTEADVGAFRRHIEAHIVPLADKIKAEQAARIGLETLALYDDPLVFPSGNAVPAGTPEELFAHGRRMYRALSPETAEFIDFMLENELFDVLSRKGKAGGGYCTSFPETGAPFIFANWGGTAHDIDVLTHEAGHALAAYLARDRKILEQRAPTMESCEIHSMSMEFFAWPWMEGFFGPQADKYRYGHLAGALTFLPYGAMVDEFQHIVYGQPLLTPEERRQIWLSLEARYRPYLDMADMPFYREGGRWQTQAHIYEAPFYYIDYCLAQTVALAFWAEGRTDPPAAWARYLALVKQAGTRTFRELVSEAGLPLPFDEAALASVAEAAAAWLAAADSTKLE